MRLIAFVVGLCLVFPAFAQSAQDTESSAAIESVPYTTIQPCDYWRYDSQSGNYQCSFYPSRINVVEASDVDAIVSALEQRIAALEARIAELEQAK